MKKIIFITVFFFWLFAVDKIDADSVTTSVTVGNSAPAIDSGPSDGGSAGTSPTNEGSDVTFTVTGDDSNGEDYYLAVCTTDAVTAVNGGAPTCDVGTWCVSDATTDETEATCTYTTLNGDSESNEWYAFVCDGNSSAASCLAVGDQGTGDNGSPFKVNHDPTFDTISNDGPKNPGQDVTWSTNVSTTDGDTDTSADTVKLVVCKTAGVSGGDCDGGASDRWCESSLVANDPSCSYTVATPTADQEYNAYVYLFDSHDLGSNGANQGTTSNFTVSNVAPVVSNVNLNGGEAIDLTEDTTTSITLTATVTDNNGCGDISTVTGDLYRSGIGASSCDDNGEDDENNCYAIESCSVVESGNTCDGAADASAAYECDVSVWHNADPTDSGTLYPTENWKDTILATDDDAATHSVEVSAGVEMNSLTALDVTASINYGNLGVGESNDPLDKITTVTATGNVGLDEELSGTDMVDEPNSIAVAYQKYALSSSTAYDSGTSLSASPTEAELNCSKTTDHTSDATQNTWWGLEIPSGTLPGSYSGTITVTAVKGETAGW